MFCWRVFFLFAFLISCRGIAFAHPPVEDNMAAAASSSAVVAARSGSSDDKEPLTRAQKLSQTAKELFDPNRFRKVIGPQIDSWANWTLFTDISAAPDAPLTLRAIHTIVELMRKLDTERSEDEVFQELYSKVLRHQQNLKSLRKDSFEDMITGYLSRTFPGLENLEFLQKKGGGQLGAIVRFNCEGVLHTFYVKTHMKGYHSSSSPAPKRVSVKELFCYEFLSGLGVGPKVRFCGDTLETVCILSNSLEEEGKFSTFARVLLEREQEGPPLWGQLDKVIRGKKEFSQEEREIAQDRVAQNFIKEMAYIDLLTRLLRLHDVLNTSDNFGFIVKSDLLPRAVIFDFRVIDGDEASLNESHWEGFLKGNGFFRYEIADLTIAYPLHYRSARERLAIVRELLRESPLKDFETIAERAFRAVSTYLTDSFQEEGAALIPALTDHKETVLENFRFFQRKVEEFRAPSP